MKSLLKTILVVGTYDTKEEELSFLCECIKKQGGGVVTMDVSVLGNSRTSADISKHQIAEMAESSIDLAINSGNENSAMQIMGRGAALKALALYQDGKIDGVIVLGGTMGTDLALDICSVLPLGVPKYVVSTVSFSAMLPPERLAP
ncbi:MAG: Tm-1-like ATP-binding domain-containing protein, partial [Proteobacteria bacterium]|nr:Tm-1-like ATP-binding domain-containing protein [Pseudomonadota bacterium]